MERRTIFAIAVGGVLGASLRLLIGFAFGMFSEEVDLLPGPSAAAQFSTLLVNVVGSALLGWLSAEMGNSAAPDSRRHRFLVAASAGFCGSFTTFSAFALVVAEYLASDRVIWGVLYGYASMSLALLAAFLGYRLRRGMLGRQASRATE